MSICSQSTEGGLPWRACQPCHGPLAGTTIAVKGKVSLHSVFSYPPVKVDGEQAPTGGTKARGCILPGCSGGVCVGLGCQAGALARIGGSLPLRVGCHILDIAAASRRPDGGGGGMAVGRVARQAGQAQVRECSGQRLSKSWIWRGAPHIPNPDCGRDDLPPGDSPVERAKALVSSPLHGDMCWLCCRP